MSDNLDDQLNELLDYMEEECGLERSEHAREVGRMVANLQD